METSERGTEEGTVGQTDSATDKAGLQSRGRGSAVQEEQAEGSVVRWFVLFLVVGAIIGGAVYLYRTVDLHGLEIKQEEYEKIQKEVRTYPQLKPLVREMLENDGKINLRESYEFARRLEQEKKRTTVINLWHQTLVRSQE